MGEFSSIEVSSTRVPRATTKSETDRTRRHSIMTEFIETQVVYRTNYSVQAEYIYRHIILSNQLDTSSSLPRTRRSHDEKVKMPRRHEEAKKCA